MEQNLNQNQSILNNGEQFDANRFKQDIENLQQNQTSNNNDTTVVTVQVPVAVPVQVPVPIQVPVAVPVEVPVAVPVYVPVASEQLEQMKQQLEQQQQQQQQQQDVSSSTANDTDTTVSNLGKEDAQNIENELNVQSKNEQETLSNEASRDSVDLNTNTEPVDLSIDTSKITELASSALSSVIDTVKSILPTSLNTETKNETEVSHKPESAVFEQAKQPLVTQPLEEEDKKLVEQTATISGSSTLNADKNITIDSVEFEQAKEPLMVQPLEKEDMKSSNKDDTIEQQYDSLNNSNEDNVKDTITQPLEQREELIPLLAKDKDFKWDNEVRSYADVAGASDENRMIAGDTKANKDVSNIQLNTSNMDNNTLSSSTLNNRDEIGQLVATEQTIPSQNDIAPQINDASA